MLLYEYFGSCSASRRSFLESSASLWFASETSAIRSGSESSSTGASSSFLIVELAHYIIDLVKIKESSIFVLGDAKQVTLIATEILSKGYAR
jgi:glutamyl-tRNA reductase